MSFVAGDHPDRHPPHSALFLRSNRRSPPRLPRDFHHGLPARQAAWLILLQCSLLFAQTSAQERPTFVDITEKSGVAFRNEPSRTSEKYLLESMVGGVALFDYDNDGDLDLYFVNGAALEDPMPQGAQPRKEDPRYWNRLYRNNGDLTFRDVTEQAGVAGHSYGQGVAVGDYDNDGFADLYVTNYGRNILYRNDGKGGFRDVTESAGVAAGEWSTGAAFFDFDSDGRLDLAVVRYVDWDFSRNVWCGERKPGYRSYCHPDNFDPITHLIYRNHGDGTFRDVTSRAGFGGAPGKGLGVAFNDFNLDGRLDLFMANDSAPQQLFQNNGDGRFEEVGLLAGVAYDEDGNVFAGMGTDFLDYDNDGLPEIFVNALPHQKYALFRNREGTFEYASGPTGVSSITALHSGWGAKFIDYDNDGWKDLFVAQGHVMDNIELTNPSLRYKEPLLLLRNRNGKFQDVSGQSGEVFSKALAARGAAFGDLDSDGFIDVVINRNEEPALLLRNEGNGNHWLIVDLIGTRSNHGGIGARLRLATPGGVEQHQIASTAGSYLSASDKRIHFGLGAENKAALLEIRWPSGFVQRLTDVRANQILSVTEPSQ